MAKKTEQAPVSADGHKLKTYFRDIHEGRSTNGERVDPHRIVICGIDDSTAAVAAQDDEAAAIVAGLTMPSNREIRPFLEDTDRFLSTAAGHLSSYMLAMLEAWCVHGQNLKPITGLRVGDYFVVVDGRHTVAAMRVIRECLAGTRRVEAISALIARLRRERGNDWRPALTAQPPAKSAETGAHIDPQTVAIASQAVRVLTLAERFELAMRRVAVARSVDEEPDYDRIGRDLMEPGSSIKSWEALSHMPRAVQKAVLEKGFPLSSALKLKALPGKEAAAKVQQMMESGDVRVATAAATAREAKRQASSASAGVDTSAKDDPSSSRTPDATDTPRVFRAPWKRREATRLSERIESVGGADLPEWRSFRAAMKLFTEGPDALGPADIAALGAVGAVVSEMVAEK